MNACYDHYGFIAELGTEWQLHRIHFDDLWREDNDGPDAPFDPTALYEIDFRGPTETLFQFDIDDLAFITCD